MTPKNTRNAQTDRAAGTRFCDICEGTKWVLSDKAVAPITPCATCNPDGELRPVWTHDVPIDVVAFFREHSIVQVIQHEHTRYHDEDPRTYTLTFIGAWTRPDDKPTLTLERRGKSGYQSSWFTFNAGNPYGLVLLSDRYRLESTLRALDAFDKKHKRELAQYRRLRKKFGDQV